MLTNMISKWLSKEQNNLIASSRLIFEVSGPSAAPGSSDGKESQPSLRNEAEEREKREFPQVNGQVEFKAEDMNETLSNLAKEAVKSRADLTADQYLLKMKYSLGYHLKPHTEKADLNLQVVEEKIQNLWSFLKTNNCSAVRVDSGTLRFYEQGSNKVLKEINISELLNPLELSVQSPLDKTVEERREKILQAQPNARMAFLQSLQNIPADRKAAFPLPKPEQREA